MKGPQLLEVVDPTADDLTHNWPFEVRPSLLEHVNGRVHRFPSLSASWSYHSAHSSVASASHTEVDNNEIVISRQDDRREAMIFGQ